MDPPHPIPHCTEAKKKKRFRTDNLIQNNSKPANWSKVYKIIDFLLYFIEYLGNMAFFASLLVLHGFWGWIWLYFQNDEVLGHKTLPNVGQNHGLHVKRGPFMRVTHRLAQGNVIFGLRYYLRRTNPRGKTKEVPGGGEAALPLPSPNITSFRGNIWDA